MRERRAHDRELAAGRDCYCGPGDRYCATCEVCGRPGHLRHFPGAVTVTGSWCARHYWRLKLLHPSGAIGCWVWFAGAMLALSLLVRLLR